MGRALLSTLATLMVLLAAAVMLLHGAGPPVLPSLGRLESLDGAALGTTMRLITWGALGLLAVLLVLRVAVALALLAGMDYAPFAYAGHMFLLPVVRRTAGGIATGMMLTTQVAGGGTGLVAAARAARSQTPVVTTSFTQAPTARAAVAGQERRSGTLVRQQTQGGPAGGSSTRSSVTARAGRSLLGRARALGRAAPEGAIWYTVQQGDTLSGIARHFYGDALAYQSLFAANRGLTQPDGAVLSSPDVLRTGWRLRVPLPSPVISLAPDGYLHYVVQEGDSLSAISLWLWGDWRRYTQLLSLNRGMRQSDGAMLSDPTLIRPGWVLRLPSDDMVPARPTGHTKAGRHITARRALTRRPVPVPTARSHEVTAYAPVSRRSPDTQRRVAPLPPPQPAQARPAPVHRPAPGHGALVRDATSTPTRGHQEGQHDDARHGALSGHATGKRTSGQASGAATPPPPPRTSHSLGAQGRGGTPARTRAQRSPTITMPDGRVLPAALLTTFFGLLALAAWRRRRRWSAPALPWLLIGAPLRSTLGAMVRPGTRGWLAAASTGRLRGDEANPLAPLVLALVQVWTERGWSAPRVEWVREEERGVSLGLRTTGDITRVGAAAADLARRVGASTARVHSTRAGATIELEHVAPTLRTAEPPEPGAGQQAGPALAWGPASPAHPLPLLVPLGASSSGDVLHVNLAELRALLVASGPLGTTAYPLLALVSAVLAQARPEQVRLLVAADPGGDLGLLRDVPHLVSPLADVGDQRALGLVLDKAEEVVVNCMVGRSRRQTGQDSGHDEETLPPDEQVMTLLLVEEVGLLLAHEGLLSRFDALCRSGAGSGLVVLAGTADVATLLGDTEGAGLLDAFSGRLCARLGDAATSRACLGDEGAETLGEDEWLYWRSIGEHGPELLRSFALHPGEAQEILAAVAMTCHPLAPPLHVLSPADLEHDEQPDQAATREEDEEGHVATTPVPADATGGGGASPENEGDAAPPLPSLDGPVPVEHSAAAEEGTVRGGSISAPLGAQDSPGDGAPGSGGATARGGEAALSLRSLSAHDPPLRLRLLGGLTLEIGGRAVSAGSGGLGRSTKELLAYLSLAQGKAVPRATMQLDFWPDVDNETGKWNFHARRKKLRTFLAGQPGLPDLETLLGERDGAYWLNPAYVWVDALAFDRLLDEASATEDPQERRDLWAEGLCLYEGALCAPTPAWAQDEAERLRGRFLDTALSLSRAQAEAGHLDAAITWLERLVREEAYNESYWRRLMRLQQRAGRQAAVTRTYEHLCSVLRKDLDTQPEEKTQEIYRRLMQGAHTRTDTHPGESTEKETTSEHG